MLLLSEVIEDPLKLPYLLEAFYTAPIKNEKAFHFALLRVQVDSDLRMHEDIQKYQQRKYVAETLEKLLYGELMLAVGESSGMENDSLVQKAKLNPERVRFERSSKAQEVGNLLRWLMDFSICPSVL